MNKSELVNAIAAGANLSKADAKKALDVTLNAISGGSEEWRQSSSSRFWQLCRYGTSCPYRY